MDATSRPRCQDHDAGQARAIHQNADQIDNQPIALTSTYEAAALTRANDLNGALIAFDAALDMYPAETRAVMKDAEREQQARLAALAARPVAAELALQALTVKVDAGDATADDQERIFVLQDGLQTAADDSDAAAAGVLAAASPAAQTDMAQQLQAVGRDQAVLAGLDRKTAILQIAAHDKATHLFLTPPGLPLHEKIDIPRGLTCGSCRPVQPRGMATGPKQTGSARRPN